MRASYPPEIRTFRPTPLVCRASSESVAGRPNRAISRALVAALMLLSGARVREPETDQLFAPPDPVEKRQRIRPHGGGQVVLTEHEAEMIGRLLVLAGLEVGEGEVEPDPQQRRVAGKHGAEACDGGLPVAPPERDRPAQKVEIVDVPLARLDASEKELGVVQLAPRERRSGGLDQGLSGYRRRRRSILCQNGR